MRDANFQYLKRWRVSRVRLRTRRECARIIKKWDGVREFGYSVDRPEETGDLAID